MISNEQFLTLLDKHLREELSADEAVVYFSCAASGRYDDIISRHIDEHLRREGDVSMKLPEAKALAIEEKIFNSEHQIAALIHTPKHKKRLRRQRLAVACVAIALVLAGLFLLSPKTVFVSPIAGTKEQDESPVSFQTGFLLLQNNTAAPQQFALEDGSTVMLQPGTRLRYPAHFEADKRQVFLEGEAFFQVTRNPKQPFYVYAKNIVTHVLGTSFTVREDPTKKQSEVLVKTGRVEVFASEETGIRESTRSNSVILLPNQKATYQRNNGRFITSLVEVPLPLPDIAVQKIIKSFYEDAPLAEVLSAMQKTYGIDIVPENENLYRCLFTGDISDQNLYTKLDIICRATSSAYEVVGTKIIIRGKGCP